MINSINEVVKTIGCFILGILFLAVPVLCGIAWTLIRDITASTFVLTFGTVLELYYVITIIRGKYDEAIKKH